MAHQKIGDVENAFDDFERATGAPEFAEPYFNRGRLYFDLGYYQDAAAEYDRAIRVDSSYADAYAQRALAFIALEKDQEARLDVERAVDLGADRAELETAIQEIKK